MTGIALVIGGSDGIGLATTRELLKRGWKITGISRSNSPIVDRAYRHIVADVSGRDYADTLKAAIEAEDSLDLCIFCAGIGELLDLTDMSEEAAVFEVNLLGMVNTVSLVIPAMIRHGRGHFIGLSSLADEMLSAEAPSYHASKAGFSNYLEGMALALKNTSVSVSNVRFGFVDTKMAKGDIRPFMMSVDSAVRHLMKCLDKKPIRYTAPWIVIPLVKFRGSFLSLQRFFNSN